MTADATLPASDDLTPEVLADTFHDALIDELHAANLISIRVPDDGDTEEWADEMPLADLTMLAERALLSGVRPLQAENIELREGYKAWKRAGTATHNALLAIWHLVTPYDTKHMTFDPDDPDSVVDAVRSRDARIAEALAALGRYEERMGGWPTEIAEAHAALSRATE